MTGPAYHLSDSELVKGLLEVASRLPYLLNPWEHDFAFSLVRHYYRSGLTWKQRRTSRQTLDRIMIALAEIHTRPDLLAVPAIAQAPLTLVRSPSEELNVVEIADRLSPAQKESLRILMDKRPHRTAQRAGGGRVAGASVKALERWKLVTASYDPQSGHVSPEVTITFRGLQVALYIEGRAKSA